MTLVTVLWAERISIVLNSDGTAIKLTSNETLSQVGAHALFNCTAMVLVPTERRFWNNVRSKYFVSFPSELTALIPDVTISWPFNHNRMGYVVPAKSSVQLAANKS